MVRLLIEDVTLMRHEEYTQMQVRFRGGKTLTQDVPNPPPVWKLRQTPPEVIAEVDDLLNEHNAREIANPLNERGVQTAMGGNFTVRTIRKLCQTYGLKSRYERLRERGLLTQEELAAVLGVSVPTIQVWYRRGLLRGIRYNNKGRGGERLYERPADKDCPRKMQGRKLSERTVLSIPMSNNQ